MYSVHEVLKMDADVLDPWKGLEHLINDSDDDD